MQLSNNNNNFNSMADSACQAPLPSLILASPPTVLPHDSMEPTQLADQASHLTLATSSGRADASSAMGPHDGVPNPSRSRSRTCSACSSAARSDVDGLPRASPPPPPSSEHEHASTTSIERCSSRPAATADNKFCLPSDAQLTPPISHEHAREETRMAAAAELERERHHMQPADALPLVSVRKHYPSRPRFARKAGNDAPLATLVNLPNEVLLHVLGYLDVCDLLLLSRVCANESCCAIVCILSRAMSTSLPPTPLGCKLLYNTPSTALLPSRNAPHVPRHSTKTPLSFPLPSSLLPRLANAAFSPRQTSHQFRTLALSPIIHRHRLRHARAILPPLLNSPMRPSLSELIARRVFLTNTTVVSRKLARSLTAIRLSRRLAVRPPPEALVARSVLPGEYVQGRVAPALVAKTRAVERERVKDGLRRWVGSVWERRWRETVEERRRGEESRGVGRVWRLRRFWERVGRGEVEAR